MKHQAQQMLIEYKQVVLDDKVIVPFPPSPSNNSHQHINPFRNVSDAKSPRPIAETRSQSLLFPPETRGSEASSRPSCCSETGQFQIA